MTTRILCLRPMSLHDGQPVHKRSAAATPPVAFDAALRTHLVADMEEFSPLIGWIDGTTTPCLCLDVGRTARSFGGETSLVERLREWTADRMPACGVALADTLGAAWAVTHFGLQTERGPWSQRIISSGKQEEALVPLPVEALRLSADVTALLRELGIHVVGQLLSLSRVALAERFAPALLQRIDQALGNVPELFAAHRPLPAWEAAFSWEEGITTAESLLTVWERLLPKLVVPLQQRGRGIARLLVELMGESQSLRRFVIGLLRPTLDARHLFDLLRLRLESVRVRESILATRLAVLEEAPLTIQQQVLFADLAPPIESQAWVTLVERLSGRLGKEAVVRVKANADHQPERTWRTVPWLDRIAKNSAAKARARGEPVPSPTFPRPALLLPRPRAIRVFAVAPQGHPHQFKSDGREQRVIESWGPERIETGWWRGPSVRRDYYRVVTADGFCCWLFRELRSGRWFLHGWFD